jgi:5-methylcytosine-specific restriction endonuclease McrA
LGLFGEGNPNWKGGKSFEEYCPVWKDEEYKQSIRERDGNVCLNPYCDSKNPNDLTIHHIDYDKQNCHPSNLITVCRSCNIRANKDRRWHKAWYSAIMSMRYADRSITYGK